VLTETGWVKTTGGGGAYRAVSASTSIDPGDGIIGVDTTGGAYTMTLPLLSAATEGEVIEVVDIAGEAGTNSITVASSGADIFLGGMGTLTISIDGGRARLLATASAWVQVGY
jgi:hypothetical protein